MFRHFLIVAGGSGNRMGTATPKQFLLFEGKPLLIFTLERLAGFSKEAAMTVVIPASHISLWKELTRTYHFHHPHRLVEGGQTRFESVRNGLNALENDEGITAIHDGVRPLVSKTLLQRLFTAAAKKGSAIPVCPIADSVRWSNGLHNKAVNREEHFTVQTPQLFDTHLIREAYRQDFRETFTDDATVFEGMGHKVNLVEGELQNIKITLPADLILAQALLRSAQF